MRKIRVKATTTVRRSGSGFAITTRVSNGKSTKTTTKHIRLR